MNILLDTHMLIWALEDNLRLSKESRELIINPDNLVFVSAASVWEISIKKSLGKLQTPDNLIDEITSHRFDLLAIYAHHSEAVISLPEIHKDPFDRMLIAQANYEHFHFITADEMLLKYPCKIIFNP